MFENSLSLDLVSPTVMALVGCLFAISLIMGIIGLPSTLRKDTTMEEFAASEYMGKLDKAGSFRKNKASIAEWQYASNITKSNDENRIQVALQNARETKQAWEETISYNWTRFQDNDLKRAFMKYSMLGISALPGDKYVRRKKAISLMQSNYAKAKICNFFNSTNCNLSIEPELIEIFESSTNPDELKSVWVQWHEQAGAKVKGAFTEYVKLSNEAAVMNNFTNYAEMWLSEYEQDDFEGDMKRIWDQMKPLYLQIHAYVRKRLWDKYGDAVISRKGPIPAHLLGNVWAQDWSNVESISRPYPDKPDIDVTSTMVAQNYTALKMFQMADEFFQSLNLSKMPLKFWENSIIEKPNDGRELVCHASAWDFSDGADFRIKQCTRVNMLDFEVVHHEMGHVEYYLQYKNQPSIFRSGANPGFHEAVGDVMALSVSTPKHLTKIGLLLEEPDDTQSEINNLFRKGVKKIVFLPFALLLDTYRYAIFRGETTPENYNCHFWKLREDLQGIEPPVTRTEKDFDAAAKYHVSADVEYARYYVSFIIQFQFHHALCEKAGQYVSGDESKKLSACDIYQSTEAGNALAKMLQMGSSRPWQDAMEIITGQRKINAGGLLEYFKPLKDWLEQENQRTGEYIGWEPTKVRVQKVDFCVVGNQTVFKVDGFTDLNNENKIIFTPHFDH